MVFAQSYVGGRKATKHGKKWLIDDNIDFQKPTMIRISEFDPNLRPFFSYFGRIFDIVSCFLEISEKNVTFLPEIETVLFW